MNSKMIPFILAAALALIACDRQYVVRGVVKDPELNPLSGANVSFYYPDTDRLESVLTNTDGQFDISYISAGANQDGFLLISSEGFKKGSLPYVAGRDYDVTVILERAE